MYVVVYKYNRSSELHSLTTKSLRFIQHMKLDNDLTVLEYKKIEHLLIKDYSKLKETL